jgi:peroxiredoxin
VELPRLQPLYEKYQNQGFEVVAVETKGQTELATKFVEQNGLTYTTVENGEGDSEVANSSFNLIFHPSSFHIYRAGKVMYYHLGFEAGDEVKLEEEIKTLL